MPEQGFQRRAAGRVEKMKVEKLADAKMSSGYSLQEEINKKEAEVKQERDKK